MMRKCWWQRRSKIRNCRVERRRKNDSKMQRKRQSRISWSKKSFLLWSQNLKKNSFWKLGRMMMVEWLMMMKEERSQEQKENKKDQNQKGRIRRRKVMMTQIQVLTLESHLSKWLIWSMENEINQKVHLSKTKEEANERSQLKRNQRMIKVKMRMTISRFLKTRRKGRRSFQTGSMCLTLEEVGRRKLIFQMINHKNPERRRNKSEIQKVILLMKKEFDYSMLMGTQLKVILIVRNHQWTIQMLRKWVRRRRKSQKTKLESLIFYLLEFSQKLKNQTVMKSLLKREKLDDKNLILPQEEVGIDLSLWKLLMEKLLMLRLLRWEEGRQSPILVISKAIISQHLEVLVEETISKSLTSWRTDKILYLGINLWDHLKQESHKQVRRLRRLLEDIQMNIRMQSQR